MGSLFASWLFTSTASSLSRLWLPTLHSLASVPMLVMCHFYMMAITTEFLKTLVFSVALRCIKLHHHSLRVHTCLQRKKINFRVMESRIIWINWLYTEYSFRGRYTMCILFFVILILYEILWMPLPCLLLTNSMRILLNKCSRCNRSMTIHLLIEFHPWILMVPYQSVWPIFFFLYAQLVYM